MKSKFCIYIRAFKNYSEAKKYILQIEKKEIFEKEVKCLNKFQSFLYKTLEFQKGIIKTKVSILCKILDENISCTTPNEQNINFSSSSILSKFQFKSAKLTPQA